MIKLEAKCDRCGKDYKLYFPKKMNKEIYFNGLMRVTFDAQHNYHRKGDVDLCHDCVSSFITWLERGEFLIAKEPEILTNVEEVEDEEVG